MVDGKTCSVLTGQKSSKCCNVCGVNPLNMNNLEHIKTLKSNEESYLFGISSLHSWIRFMECILHISYNLDFMKSSARKDDKGK